jgi:rhodanese-related sulfurtransferase
MLGHGQKWELDILELSQNEIAAYDFIDIREPGEESAGIMTTLFRSRCAKVPLSKFDVLNPPLEKSKQYLIVCQRGLRSGKLVAELRSLGWDNVYAITGGIEAIRRKYIA